MTTRRLLLASLACFSGLALGIGSPLASAALPSPSTAVPAADDTAAAYKRLIEAVGPALVNVKCVMKIEGGGAEQFGESGRDVETAGLMVESSGLVIVSNVKMGGMASRMGMSMNPTNIKVLIGDDTEGLKSKIIARDPELDLCWIQIDDDKAKGTTHKAVDFSAGTSTEVGDKVFVVERMGKFFDHALSVSEGRIGGSVKKPRAMLIPTGFGSSRDLLGMPLFNAEGKAVGLNVLQLPDKEDMEGGDMGENSFAVLLLSSADVVKATTRGKEMAAKNPPKEEPKDEPKSEDKPPEKKDEPKKE